MSTEAPVIRRPAVAGYYYPNDPTALAAQVDALAPEGAARTQAAAVLVPHDSFHRSGAVAGAALSQVTVPRRCIVLGASHTDSWMRWSLMRHGAYRTPLGEVPIDAACADELQIRCPFLEADAWTQRGEHAIEVVLPFLQRLAPPDLAIVPIIVGSDDREEFRQMAQALAQVIRLQEEPVLLIASSNLSHFETQTRGAEQDRMLIDTLCRLDADGLIRSVENGESHMCGYGAAACALEAARTLGATRGRLIRYGASVDAGGDPGSVIGYAGILVE